MSVNRRRHPDRADDLRRLGGSFAKRQLGRERRPAAGVAVRRRLRRAAGGGGERAERHGRGRPAARRRARLRRPARRSRGRSRRPSRRPPTRTGRLRARTDGIDLSALRYFAGQNDLSRVAAEIRLIRSKHPDWQPPDDLFSGSKGSELEAPLWKLFAERDYAGVRAGIAQIQQNTPDWRPSADLLGKLTLAEASENLVKASDDGQWGTVIEIAAANKMLLTCAYVDALWRTAEALVRTDDEPRAVEAYRYILTTCAKPEERLATVQKAGQLLDSPEDLDGLLQLGRRLPDGRSEFESVRLDIIRKKIGDAAAGNAEPAPSPSEIETVAAHARNAKDQNDQQLLGWYAYAHKDYVQAESWFRMALQARLQPTPRPPKAWC